MQKSDTAANDNHEQANAAFTQAAEHTPAPQDYGFTPLHGISRMDKFDSTVAERVIKITTNLNVTNGKGETPLSLAMAEGRPHIVRLLVDAGASNGESNLDVEEL